MLKCPSCGSENKDDAKFCFSCGVSVVQPTPESAPAAPPPPPPPPPSGWPRPKEKGPDYIGLVGLAVFLFVVGLVFYVNPGLGADLRIWADRAARDGPFIRPPDGVITSAILFFFLMGISSFATAALRFAARRHRFRALSDSLGGVGLVILAFLLSLYADRRISGQLVLATWVAVLGLLLLIYVSLGIYFSWVRHVPSPAPGPTTRP